MVVAPALSFSLTPDKADQRGLERAVGLPQLSVENAVDAGPHLWVGQVFSPVGADVSTVQFLHCGSQPGAHMHAVGDVTDRHLVLTVVRPERLPGSPGHPAVQTRHPVRVARHLEGQYGHAQSLVGILRSHPAQPEKLLPR